MLLILCSCVAVQSESIYFLSLTSKSEHIPLNRMPKITHIQQQIDSFLNCIHNSTGYNFHLMEINQTYCHPTSLSGYCLLQAFIQHKFHHNNYNIVGIITTAYHMESVIVSSLLSHMNIAIPFMYASSLVSDTATGSGIFYMSSSSSVIVNAFLHLLKEFNWTRIGIISNNLDTYFSRTTNLLLKKADTRNIKISPYIEYTTVNVNNEVLVQHIKDSNTKIIFLSVDCYVASQILHTAYLNNLTWPKYAWIVHSIETHEMLRCNFSLQVLQGVIFINQDVTTNIDNDFEQPSSEKCMINASVSDSHKQNISYDAIRSIVAATLNNISGNIISHVDFQGSTGRITFTDNQVARNVRITQVKNYTEILQAYFYRNSSTLQSYFHGTVPDDDIPRIRRSQIPLWFAVLEITICFIIVTIILILYLYYRNTAEIKATSVTLSILIFIGCYLLLAYLTLNTIRKNIKANLELQVLNTIFCHITFWLNGMGFSLPLILAVLLVKMLRIYHIFNTFGKASKLSSDLALGFFILMIVSPNILILILFSSLSSYTLQAIEIEKVGYIEVGPRCEGDLAVFLMLMLTYLLFLMLAVVSVAIKSRKIRMRRFRDTKKVNALIFILVLLAIQTPTYWLIINSNDDIGWKSNTILHVAHILAVLSCQFCLFLPKILPSVRKSLNC